MRFDDEWEEEAVLDAYSIREDEYRFDRVAHCTVVCTDIVGGAKLFRELSREAFDALLAEYLHVVRRAFGAERIYHTLRDDIFIAFDGDSREALALALDFNEHMRAGSYPFTCSIGISSGELAILTHGAAIEPQGAAVAVAKGLAKIARARAVFIDARTADALDVRALRSLSPLRRVRLPHVGQVLGVYELIGADGLLGVKDRFANAPVTALREGPRV